MERAEEITLIARSRHGDAVAFGRLVEEHKGRVLATCLRLLGNVEDAKDVTQEAFVQAFLGLERFREEARFATWLYRIAVNLCQNALRRRGPTLESLEESFADAGPSPEDWSAGRERRQLVDRALQGLSPELRVPVVLRDSLGWSYAEIAEAAGIPLGTVKSRISAARWALRRALEAADEL